MKMNLKDIMGTLNRDEMKRVMAGSGGENCSTSCLSNEGKVLTCTKATPSSSCTCPTNNPNNACG